jgi:hypothetical protein
MMLMTYGDGREVPAKAIGSGFEDEGQAAVATDAFLESE